MRGAPPEAGGRVGGSGRTVGRVERRRPRPGRFGRVAIVAVAEDASVAEIAVAEVAIAVLATAEVAADAADFHAAAGQAGGGDVRLSGRRRNWLQHAAGKRTHLSPQEEEARAERVFGRACGLTFLWGGGLCWSVGRGGGGMEGGGSV